jgi:proteasome accessory factor C
MKRQETSNGRLRRLLMLVPTVSQKQGIHLEALASALGCTREEVLDDLELLQMVGRPPFQPGEYVELAVEDDRVYVELDQRLEKPPRLTAAEATALSSAARLVFPAASDVLGSALAKLEKALGAGAGAKAEALGRVLDAGQAAPPDTGRVEQAVRARRELRFDYFSPERGSVRRRTVQPLELISLRGQWYLAARCLEANEERLFRLDRATAVELGERTFPPEPSRPSALPPSPWGRGEVRVRFSRAVAAWAQEQFGQVGVTVLPDGTAEVQLDVDSEAWLVGWVLSFGGEAELIAPDGVRRNIARAALASLE